MAATVARALRLAFGWKGNRDYHPRRIMIEAVMENTILHGWTPGLGPDDRPYRECNPRELIGSRRRKPAVNQI